MQGKQRQVAGFEERSEKRASLSRDTLAAKVFSRFAVLGFSMLKTVPQLPSSLFSHSLWPLKGYQPPFHLEIQPNGDT